MFVITLGCLEHIPKSINFWPEVGLYAKNSLRYIDVRKLFKKPGKNLCRALSAFHAFISSDYTTTFSRKGKILSLKTLEKDKTLFGDMAFSDDILGEEFKVMEKFSCALYGNPKFNSINEVRLELFLKKYQPKKKENVIISCVKKAVFYLLVVQQKTNRTNHIAGKLLSLWPSHPKISNPLNCGWELSSGHWKIRWFEGKTAAKSVELITADELNVVDDDENGKVYFLFW